MSQAPITPAALTGVILAGGAARRMGGADKGLLMLGQRPLVSWLIEALSSQVGRILIVANRNLEAYRAFGHPVVEDIRPDFAGPLAGFEAALTAAPGQWLLCCPVDAPLLPGDFAQRMLQASAGGAAVATLAGRLEPLHALIPPSALPDLARYLADGGRKTSQWLESLRPARVAFDDQPQIFLDSDTPQALQGLHSYCATPSE